MPNDALNSGDDLAYVSAAELARAIRARELSPVEVVDATLERIERHDGAVNAFITVIAEQARDAANRAEHEVMSKPPESLGRLHGVPISVKDLTPTAGVVTTYGLRERSRYVPGEDGTAWARLKAEGPILLGKTATPPLGMLCVTESELNGVTSNPWDLSRTAGGSSGGAAAAVAAGFGPIATGSDGGASIRVPASFCGVIGLKPTPGRIPLIPEASRFETTLALGPITRTVADCALAFSIMAGPHTRDPFAIHEPQPDFVVGLDRASVTGKRIAFCVDSFGEIEPDVVEAIHMAAMCFETDLDANVDFVSMTLPDTMEYYNDYWVSLMALGMNEIAGLNFSAYPPLVDWLERASHATAAQYLSAAFGRRDEIHEAFATVFDTHDLLITPTTPQVAFPHPPPELRGASHCNGKPTAIPAVDHARLTDPPTQANCAAITIPCSFNADGLPIGMQIIAPAGGERAVLQAAAAFEPFSPTLDRHPCLDGASG